MKSASNCDLLLRVAMYNISMSDTEPEKILALTSSSNNPRLRRLAAIIQHAAADVILLCEFDHLGAGGDDGALANFCDNYLSVGQYDQRPIKYPYRLCPATNTGLLTGIDLNNDGVISLPADGMGFGHFHGNFGFVLLSKYPIQNENIRSWQHMLWNKMPNALIPRDFYSDEAIDILRLSSKNHLIVPIEYDQQVINLVCCHPTPPVFDGPERRNAKRNHDEIQLVCDILDNVDYLEDDRGNRGGLSNEQSFIVLGDLNADVVDGDGLKAPIKQLLNHSRIHQQVSHGALTPKSDGGSEYRPWQRRKGRRNEWTHLGGMRLDYVLPSDDLTVLDSGVFWPSKKHPLRQLILDDKGREKPTAGSDHRLVWVDIAFSENV
ncbi:Endonuclease/Exonuclease/phosphatase family protein [Photobacterium malacitanum]|uniref:Endonuclease/Exonuclease/phosphatase family protein n=1 Tax=Photobacterium malacitanum TaxID=2204294 RepID=A0A1Y6MKY0_9GAMM|nr:endonuclease/exonuclease/phosphatase family protein [Photobacterium malacitanum]SMY35861.1 Endonuclease/Exonuclease/phosphatase family protein [Photobacterium malacitanum]